ncbi:MAG: hypothetical protein WAZ77_15715 [Candidatus Nitrosopolaris sp.]
MAASAKPEDLMTLEKTTTTVNHSDEENHTHRQIDNHYSWLWNLMDSTTRCSDKPVASA